MSESKKGIINATIAYTLWGVYPIYWALLQGIPPTEILTNRIIGAFFTLLFFILVLRLLKPLKETILSLIKDKKKLTLLFIAAILISNNWLIFTFAAVSGRILEVSLGYYINPLLSILIGVVLLKERLNKYQVVAVLIASLGVIFLALSYGTFPWISMALALSFGFYGVVKKVIQIDPIFSLFLETTLAFPAAVFFFTLWLLNGTSAFVQPENSRALLLLFAGLVTISPLYFFSKATKQLPLTVLGFLQYIGPTINIFVAVLVLGEHFSTYRFISFGFIWVACLLFSTSHLFSPKTISSNDRP